jgi:hypothetical protein
MVRKWLEGYRDVSKTRPLGYNPHRGFSSSLDIHGSQDHNCANRYVMRAGVSWSPGRPSTALLRLFTPNATEGVIIHKETDFGVLSRLSPGIQGHLNLIWLV